MTDIALAPVAPRVRRYRSRAPLGLTLAGVGVALVFALPLGYLLWQKAPRAVSEYAGNLRAPADFRDLLLKIREDRQDDVRRIALRVDYISHSTSMAVFENARPASRLPSGCCFECLRRAD